MGKREAEGGLLRGKNLLRDQWYAFRLGLQPFHLAFFFCASTLLVAVASAFSTSVTIIISHYQSLSVTITVTIIIPCLSTCPMTVAVILNKNMNINQY